MTQYIPKPPVVAELERRRDAALMRQRNLEAIGQETVLNEMIAFNLNKVISFLDTLEVKEVDLEKYYHDFLEKEWFDKGRYRTISEMMAFTAKHFFELGLKVQKGKEI